MRKLLVGLLIGLYCLSANASKKVQPTNPPVTYALWNMDTGEFIASNNESEVRPIASITKLMSVFVTMREGLDLNEEVVVTGKESSNRIKAGMRLARSKLIELALISSDNLAARTLAETYPGGYHQFINEMNMAAIELGMKNTRYADATGLLGTNISNADDIRKLVVAVSPFHIITNAANTAKYAFKTTVSTKNKSKEIIVKGHNTNSFVGRLDIIAAKTGYTSKAGRCLAMFFNHNGTKYLLVVMGAQSSEQRKKMVEHLLDKIK